MSNVTDTDVLEKVLVTSTEQGDPYWSIQIPVDLEQGENVEDQRIWVAFPMLYRISKSSLSPTVLSQAQSSMMASC